MKYKALFIWLGLVVASVGFGFWYTSHLQRSYLQDSATFRPPVAVVRPSPWSPDEQIMTSESSGKTVWSWNVVTGRKTKLVIPTVPHDTFVYDIYSAPGKLILLMVSYGSNTPQYYLATQSPVSSVDWRLIKVDSPVLDILGDAILTVPTKAQATNVLSAQNLVTGSIAPFVELPSSVVIGPGDVHAERLVQYKEFQGTAGLVRLIMTTKHIWRQVGGMTTWRTVESQAIAPSSGGIRVVQLNSGQHVVLYDDIAKGMQGSFDEGESFAPLQDGLGTAYAPYIFTASSGRVATFTPSLRQSFLLNSDGRSWKAFKSNRAFDQLPLN